MADFRPAGIPYDASQEGAQPTTQAPNDLPHVYANPQDFGAQIGQAEERLGAQGEKVGDEGIDLAIRRQQIQNTATVNNAQNAWFNGANRLLNDPKTGFFSMSGYNASNAAPQVLQQLRDSMAQTRASLGNPMMQNQFDQVSRRWFDMYQERIGAHADQQYKAANYQNFQSTVSNFMQAGTLMNDYRDGGAYDVSIAEAQKQTIQQADLNGYGDQWADKEIRAVVGKPIAQAAVNLAQAGRIDEAQGLLDRHAGLMDAPTSKLATTAVQTKGAALWGQSHTMQLAGIQQDQSGNPRFIKPQTESAAASAQEAPTTDNNLGNIRATPTSYRSYSTPEQGVADAVNNLRTNYRGLTLTQIAEKWAPSKDKNNPAQWAANVSAASGLPLDQAPNMDDPIQLSRLAHGIAVAEQPKANLSRFSMSTIESGVQQALSPGAAAHVERAQALDIQAQVEADAVKQYPNNPELQRAAVASANSIISVAKSNAMADAAAAKAANDNAASGFMKRLSDIELGDPAKMMDGYRSLQRDVVGSGIDPTAMEKLHGIIQNHIKDLGSPDKSYGTEFNNVIQGQSPTELMQMVQRNDGSLTPKGYNQIIEWRTKNNAESVKGMLDYAKSQLSFEQDTGPVKIPDKNGQAIYNSQFLPKFTQALNAAKDPAEFLTRENMDKLMSGMRSKSQMAMDRIQALNDPTGETKLSNLPPDTPVAPPQGIDPDAWKDVFTMKPVDTNGHPWANAAWGKVLDILRQNPDDSTKAHFERDFHMDPNDILKRLNAKPEPHAEVTPVVPHPVGLPAASSVLLSGGPGPPPPPPSVATQ